MDLNKVFVCLAHNLYDSDTYIGADNKLYAYVWNNFFDETGQKFIDINSVTKIDWDECIIPDDIDRIYRPFVFNTLETWISNVFDNTLRNLQEMLNFTMVQEVSSKIFIIRINNEIKVLTLERGDNGGMMVLDELANAFILFSRMGLTPYVHNYGQIEYSGFKFLYLISDYIPKVLKDVNPGPKKNELLKRALIIIYAIQGLGYSNLDNHDENFLYDEVHDKLYAIDFSDIQNNGEFLFDDTFYLSDLDKRVTVGDILNNIY